jgi:hypothetical protein
VTVCLGYVSLSAECRESGGFWALTGILALSTFKTPGHRWKRLLGPTAITVRRHVCHSSGAAKHPTAPFVASILIFMKVPKCFGVSSAKGELHPQVACGVCFF